MSTSVAPVDGWTSTALVLSFLAGVFLTCFVGWRVQFGAWGQWAGAGRVVVGRPTRGLAEGVVGPLPRPIALPRSPSSLASSGAGESGPVSAELSVWQPRRR